MSSYHRRSGSRSIKSNGSRFHLRGFWTNVREARLMEWFEQNPIEAKLVIMNSHQLRDELHIDNEGKLMTKESCYYRASQFILGLEDDPRVLRVLELDSQDLKTFRTRIRAQISRWVKTYNDINEEIMNIYPNVKLEEIQIGTQIYREISGRYSDFPFWGRLHAHWYGVAFETADHLVSDDTEEVEGEGNRTPELADRLREPAGKPGPPNCGIATEEIQKLQNTIGNIPHNENADITAEQKIRLQELENEASRMKRVQEVVIEFIRSSFPTDTASN